MLVRPLTRPLVRPLTRRVTQPGFGRSAMAVLFEQAGIVADYSGITGDAGQILVKKLRSDSPEFAVYTAMPGGGGLHWSRWYMTNRFNTGNSGAPRMLRCSQALLYASETTESHAENLTTGTEGQAPLSTQATGDATSRVGTWTADGTVGGVTGIRYSTAIGDKVVYTVTGVERLVWRHYNNVSNGGIVKVTILQSGVEIDADLYLVPLSSGDRIINLRNNSGQFFTPLAEGLSSGATYTVEIEVHSTNPAGGRAYDGGVRLYAATAFDAVGRHGTWAAVTVGLPTETSYTSGTRVVYQFTGTRVDWRWVNSTIAGIAEFTVYDAAGAEIATYENESQDCYLAATSLVRSTTVARNLTPGTYYLHVTTATTKNASATAYRLMDEGVVAYDETQGGTLGVDTFDDQGIVGSAAVEGTVTAIGTGNLEYAVRAFKPSETTAESDFCGGSHGHESAPAALTYTIDGAVIDFAGASVDDTWIGSRFSVSCSSSLLFPSDSTEFSDIDQVLSFDRSGYRVDLTETYTADAKVIEDYTMMFNVPNTEIGTQGASGGFANFAALGDTPESRTFVGFDDSSNALSAQVSAAIFWNADFVAYGEQMNVAEVNESFTDESFDGIRPLSFVQDRSDKFVKWYNRAFSGVDGGVTVPAGTVVRSRKRYQAIKR